MLVLPDCGHAVLHSIALLGMVNVAAPVGGTVSAFPAAEQGTLAWRTSKNKLAFIHPLEKANSLSCIPSSKRDCDEPPGVGQQSKEPVLQYSSTEVCMH